MNKLKNTIKQLWKDESGQGATEYILILVVVATIVMVFKDRIKEIIASRTGEVGDKLGDAIGNLSTP
ncbi:MAG: Flp1 family type IVb pilin [Bdellovibrionaceae bacterium]|nr:Flp1 family type IVb pilin [Pseudobdellovibrionaceae bacterium]